MWWWLLFNEAAHCCICYNTEYIIEKLTCIQYCHVCWISLPLNLESRNASTTLELSLGPECAINSEALPSIHQLRQLVAGSTEWFLQQIIQVFCWQICHGSGLWHIYKTPPQKSATDSSTRASLGFNIKVSTKLSWCTQASWSTICTYSIQHTPVSSILSLDSGQEDHLIMSFDVWFFTVEVLD